MATKAGKQKTEDLHLQEAIQEMVAATTGEAPAPDYESVRAPLDIAAMRKGLGYTQQSFARALGISVATLRNWEQNRRSPTSSTRLLLEIFRLRPAAVREVLGQLGQGSGAENGDDGQPLNFRPLHDRVVVRRVDAAEKSAGGIILPDVARENPQEGEIIAVGEGVRDDAGQLVPMNVRAGDRVLFGKWSGAEVKVDGEDLIIMKESDIIGIFKNRSVA